MLACSSDVLTTLLYIALIQLVITLIAVCVDLLIVFRGVWLPLMRSMPKEDRPFLWRGVASYARLERERIEREARMKERERGR